MMNKTFRALAALMFAGISLAVEAINQTGNDRSKWVTSLNQERIDL